MEEEDVEEVEARHSFMCLEVSKDWNNVPCWVGYFEIQ